MDPTAKIDPRAVAAGAKPHSAKPVQAFKAALLAAQAAAPRAPAVPPRHTTIAPSVPDSAFRHRIAATESRGAGYAAHNQASGALGRYQLIPLALRDIGWRDAAGGWTALAARHGVGSDAQFLGSPVAQEAAMDAYLRRTAQLLGHHGALARAGEAIAGLDGGTLRLSEAGLLAAAHRRGPTSVARYLAHRSTTPDAPLSTADRSAFAAVERRLRDFAEVSLPTPRSRGV